MSQAEPLQEIELSTEQGYEPLSLRLKEKQPWPISPSEAVQIAVERSKVLQDLGGASLRNSHGIATIHEPAIQVTDPRLGVEQALAAFDAQFNFRTYYAKNDFPINNRLLGGGTNLLQQDLVTFQNEVTKATAIGNEEMAKTARKTLAVKKEYKENGSRLARKHKNYSILQGRLLERGEDC